MSSERPLELHLVTRRADLRAWGHLRVRLEGGGRQAVILLHDAVLETEEGVARALGEEGSKVVVMACAADAEQRRVTERWVLVDYPGIIECCAAATQVTSW
ncbi:MAG: hypothetical protein ACRENX_01785 [Candidatus Dormibacteria bacterium]